jgi:hypothetical protein
MVTVGVTLLAVFGEMMAGYLELKNVISHESAAQFRVSKDWSFGEMFGYVFLQTSVVWIFKTGRQIASMGHLYIAGLIQFMLFDDALQFHERAGVLLGGRFFARALSVRPQDFGELMYAAIVTLIALSGLIWTYRKTTVTERVLGFFLVVPIFMILFFAIGVDFIHALIPNSKRMLGGAVATIEDGSELGCYGLLLLMAAAQWQHFDKSSHTGTTA